MGPVAGQVSRQLGGDDIGQRHGAIRRRCLGRSEAHALAADAHELAVDLHGSAQEVDPIHGQSEQLPRAKSGPRSHQHHRPVAVGNGLGQRVNLLGSKKAAARKTAAAKVEKVELRQAFDFDKTFEALDTTLAGISKEKGLNPSQIRRLRSREVTRVELERARFIAKALGVAYDKMWGPDSGPSESKATPAQRRSQRSTRATVKATSRRGRR